MILFIVQIRCPNCGTNYQDLPGDVSQFRCPVCGNPQLLRIQTDEERNRDALVGLAAGAAIGAGFGLAGALIGALVGVVLGANRKPRAGKQQ